MDDYDQQELGSMTVRCILCRGLVIYKDGDMTRFTSHLANEHGAFFDVEYLLASCFMAEDQKRAIANPVLGVPSEMPVTTNERSVKMEIADQSVTWKRSDFNIEDEPVATSHLPEQVESLPTLQPETKLNTSANEVFTNQKENLDTKRRHCGQCSKSYTRNEALYKHIKKAHGSSNNDELPKVDAEVSETVDEVSEAIDDSIDSTASTNIVTDQSTLSESTFEESFDAAADSLMESIEKELMDLENGFNTDETPAKIDDKVESSENVESSEASKPKTDEKIESPKQRKEGAHNYNAIVEQLMTEGIDIKKSAYFTKTRQVINVAGSNEAKFLEEISFLPEGWKFRTVEAKDKGKVVIHKHYLTPTKFVLKATMAVVEYLRLEGKMKPEEILKLAKNLRVGDKKLKKLFANESTDDSTNNEETVAEA